MSKKVDLLLAKEKLTPANVAYLVSNVSESKVKITKAVSTWVVENKVGLPLQELLAVHIPKIAAKLSLSKEAQVVFSRTASEQDLMTFVKHNSDVNPVIWKTLCKTNDKKLVQKLLRNKLMPDKFKETLHDTPDTPDTPVSTSPKKQLLVGSSYLDKAKVDAITKLVKRPKA